MIQTVVAGTPAAKRALAKLNTRMEALESTKGAAEAVSEIIGEVRQKGDKAVFAYTKKFDGFDLNAKNIKVSASERKAAAKRVSKDLRAALEQAASRIFDYQKRILPTDFEPFAASDGSPDIKCGLSWYPLRRVGLYIPGGTAAYPSSVLMNAIPALAAGVKEIALATPCGKDGKLNDGVLCACEILGLTEIYRMGGAQAIAALAYGTKSVKPVDKIAGPGNRYVMLAKRMVFGRVDIDMLAGPSEVLVIADEGANPAHIAADLLAQAEHDKDAACVLVAIGKNVAKEVALEVEAQLKTLPRREIAAKSIADWGLIVTAKSRRQAVELANQIAPEHLELLVKNPHPLVKELYSAGAIFVGTHATEPLGDYIAGPSHTLPTGGTARAFSGVSVHTFLRRSSVIEAGVHGLDSVSKAICDLADAEGLEAHKRAVLARMK